MELGQKIKALRLEKGLSQRQICGEFMTRNMLSLIENGAAKPSMDTLRYLAARLETPVSYFLEEQVVTSPNERLMGDARAALALGNLDGLRQALDGFREPDAVFWEERQLLEFYWHLQQGAGALAQGRLPYACTLLERALALPGLYITKALRQRARVLLTLAGGEGHPDNEDTALLALAMEETDPRRQAAILEAADRFMAGGDAFTIATGRSLPMFAQKLRETTGLPVNMWDERRTTVEAHNILSQHNYHGKKRKETVDAVAASLILEGYLAFRGR